MNKSTRIFCSICGLISSTLLFIVASGQPRESRSISLHPENPHYFLWRGQPTILITSGEHYGAVLNLDFDYIPYLDMLAKDGLNSTRIFTGVYSETVGNFKIVNNTLAPAPKRLICPWARSGDKFDLTKWDEHYFKRLRDFIAKASERSIVVEVNLFCPFYEDSMWGLSPMNIQNNINNVGAVERSNVYTLDKNGGLLPIQEAVTRKIVAELKDFDNVYYEICNEPYFGGVTMEWQRRIADVITDAQKDFPHKFLISQNIANGSQKIINPHPAVSIFNFHYATPPDAVALNYAFNKVVGDNETGFRGTADNPYRMEAWDFIIAGGALYNNLDYSFTVEHPDGTWAELPATMPGGGGQALRRQLKILKDFISGFDFIRMKPDNGVIVSGVPGTLTARALVERGKAYAIYVRILPLPKQSSAGSSEESTIHAGPVLGLELPPGCYSAEWIDTKSGDVINRVRFKHSAGAWQAKFPDFKNDIALRVRVCRE
jgi:Cellulase (glycosyl hydrolase family 5)